MPYRGSPSGANVTTEDIQDVVGGMVTGNVETGIAVTYDDTNGKLDFAASAGANLATIYAFGG